MPILRQPFGLKHIFGSIANYLWNSAGDEVKQLAENDGTERNQSILANAAGAQVRQLAENDGTERNQLILADGTATQRRARSDVNGRLWNRRFWNLDESNAAVTGVLLTTSATTVYTMAAATHGKVWVEVVNTTSTAVAVTLHTVPTGGSVSATNMILSALLMGPNSLPLRLGPYTLDAGDTIRGLAGTTNVVSARVYVELESDT